MEGVTVLSRDDHRLCYQAVEYSWLFDIATTGHPQREGNAGIADPPMGGTCSEALWR